PLVQHKLSYLRDKTTPTVHFRKLVNELTLLLTYEATRELPLEDAPIETPLEQMTAQRISGKKVAVCPVLRAGMGMLDGVLSLVSSARVGFIGLYRDEETLQPVQYYVKLPTDLSERDAIVLDPMLATGNSSVAAIVVLLTPAVGGMARTLGVVDAPGGRRLNLGPVPRLGGVALFLGIFVPALAFLDLNRETRGLLLGAAVAVTVGAIDDYRGL